MSIENNMWIHLLTLTAGIEKSHKSFDDSDIRESICCIDFDNIIDLSEKDSLNYPNALQICTLCGEIAVVDKKDFYQHAFSKIYDYDYPHPPEFDNQQNYCPRCLEIYINSKK